VVAVIWQFEARPDKTEEFERLYGADGEWTKLSRRSRSFLGSSFLRDLATPERYVLVEYWSEMLVYEKHLVDFDAQIKALEKRREECLVRVEPAGVYTALDVPDRFGPTWSQRSGA
jgi:quinol monooxygenase YgiN